MEMVMQMPNKYIEVCDDEMMYVEGGSVSLSMSKMYLSKSTCLALASTYVRYGAVTGMTRNQVAEEMYAHAVIYYAADSVRALGISNSIISYCINCGKDIDIADGGDTLVRRTAFALIWTGIPYVLV